MNTRCTLGAILIGFTCSIPYAHGGQVINETLVHDGIQRSYRVYVPDSYTGNEAWPVVINMHGATSNPSQQMSTTRMNAVADEGDFLVVYPRAVAELWNDVQDPSRADDVGFISALIDELGSDFEINFAKVYATGFSQGGNMSYLLASELSERIAAIASVSGTFASDDGTVPSIRTAPRPLPVLDMHGTGDNIVPITGGFSVGRRFAAIADVVAAWVENNGCVEDPTVTQLPNVDLEDDSTVQFIEYSASCSPYVNSTGDELSAGVSYYIIENGGHTWPGGSPIPFGPTNQDISASWEIWRFFVRHELPMMEMEPLLGDLDLDGAVNGLDVDPFVDVLLASRFDVAADMNGDGVVNGLDVEPFVAAVVGGAQSVPEPSTLLLCLTALGVVGGWRKWKWAPYPMN